MPLIGDTIRLKGEFKDFNGELTDIENQRWWSKQQRKVILDGTERIEESPI